MTKQNNEEMQFQAFNKMLEIAKEASLEILVVTDNDIELALDGNDDALAQLTPDVLKKIKRDFIDDLHDNFQYTIQDAIAKHIK